MSICREEVERSESSGQGVRTVLCVPTRESSLKEMLSICERLAATGRFRCAFVNLSCSAEWMDKVRRAGHQVVLDRGARHPKSRNKSPRTVPAKVPAPRRRRLSACCALPVKILGWIVQLLLLDSLVRLARNMLDLRKTIRAINRVLDDARPSLILVPMDSGIAFHSTLIIQARQRNIPSLVAPFAVWEPKSLVFARAGRADYVRTLQLRTAANRLAALLHPRHVIRDGEQELLVARGETILAARLLNVLPPDPARCYAGCGLAARVAVEGKRNWRICVNRGVPPQLLTITGRVSSDRVSRILAEGSRHRRQVCQQLGIPIQNRILLFSVPPLAEQGFRSWPRHLEEMDVLVKVLASFDKVKLVLSPHPTCHTEKYEPIATRYGAAIANQHSIEELAPASHLFVSAFSSTTVIAMGCGVPAINVDFYGMNYELFDQCGGIITVEDKHQLSSVVNRILMDDEYHARLSASQRSDAQQWMQLDGRCGDRMLAEIDNLIQTSGAAPIKRAA